MSPKRPKIGGDTRAKAAANGKKVGRPPKGKIEVSAASVSKDVAGRVLSKVDQDDLWMQFLHADKHIDELTARQRDERKFALSALTNRDGGLPARMEKGSQNAPGGNELFAKRLYFPEWRQETLKQLEKRKVETMTQ